MRNIITTMETILIIGGIFILLISPFEATYRDECIAIGSIFIAIGIILYIIGYLVGHLN